MEEVFSIIGLVILGLVIFILVEIALAIIVISIKNSIKYSIKRMRYDHELQVTKDELNILKKFLKEHK